MSVTVTTDTVSDVGDFSEPSRRLFLPGAKRHYCRRTGSPSVFPPGVRVVGVLRTFLPASTCSVAGDPIDSETDFYVSSAVNSSPGELVQDSVVTKEVVLEEEGREAGGNGVLVFENLSKRDNDED